MTDQFGSKGPYVERVDLESSDLGKDAPRCSLDVRVQLSDGQFLKSDVLRLQSFSGTEGISQPFEFKLDIRANDYTFYDSTFNWTDIEKADNQPRLDMDALLGAPITVMIGLTETSSEALLSYPDERRVSSFNGIIYDVAMQDRGVWNITMKPRLSLLGLQSSYRMFEDKTILQVIEAVLSQNGISYSANALRDGGVDLDAKTPVVTGLGTFRTQSWLQAGETDLDFLSRLMDKAGMFFYFVHSSSDHLMVLTDQSYYQLLYEPTEEGFDEGQEVKKLYLTSPNLGVDFEDSISQFSFQRSLSVRGVSTVLAGKQASWESADAANVAPVYRDDRLFQPTLSMQKMHIVSYGAGEAELDIRKERLEKQLLSAKSSLSGSSGYPSLRSGFVFELAEARDVSGFEEDTLKDSSDAVVSSRRSLMEKLKKSRKLQQAGISARDDVGLSLQDPGDLRPELAGAQMVAVSVTHSAKIDGSYSNQFTAFDRYGYGKAFEAAGDRDGSVVAQVCDRGSNTERSSILTVANVTKFLKSNFVSKYFLDKSAFVDKHQRDFYTKDSSNPTYKAIGVYVQLINSGVGSKPVWVRLSEGMTTIPERGAFVLLGRARDDTEVPEIQQVIDSVGSRGVNPQHHSKHTSWGDSYSTNYGDSHRVSVPQNPSTGYETFTSIVEDKKAVDYTDVSFSENSPYNFSFSPKSFSRNVSGTLPAGVNLAAVFDAPKLTQDNVQSSQSKTYGDTHSYSYHTGSAFSESHQDGDQTSSNITNGDTNHSSTQLGDQTSTTIQTGQQVSNSTINGNTLSTHTHNGISDSRSVNSVSNSASAIGSSSSESSVGASTSLSVTELSTSVSATDISLSASMTGATLHGSSSGVAVSASLSDVNVSTSITGVNLSESVTSFEGSTSMTGARDHMSITAVSESVNITALSNELNISGIVEGTSINMVGEKLSIKAPGIAFESHPEAPKIQQTLVVINMIAAIKIEM